MAWTLLPLEETDGGSTIEEGRTMDETIRLMMLAECEAIDRANDALLALHPEIPRYCYTCQRWLDNQQASEKGHAGHSIH